MTQGRSVRRTRRHAGGFSLLELLIVLGIILLLAGIGGVVLFNRRDQADAQAAQIQLNEIKNGLRLFYNDFRRYPTEDEGLSVLWDKSKLDSEGDETLWMGYMERVGDDPWGNAYEYTAESEDFDPDAANDTTAVPYEIWSNGPDGEPETDDDIKLSRGGSDEEDEFGSDLIGEPQP